VATADMDIAVTRVTRLAVVITSNPCTKNENEQMKKLKMDK